MNRLNVGDGFARDRRFDGDRGRPVIVVAQDREFDGDAVRTAIASRSTFSRSHGVPQSAGPTVGESNSRRVQQSASPTVGESHNQRVQQSAGPVGRESPKIVRCCCDLRRQVGTMSLVCLAPSGNAGKQFFPVSPPRSRQCGEVSSCGRVATTDGSEAFQCLAERPRAVSRES